jgi:hypothetical protein
MLQWVSADLSTGVVIADLPSFDGSYPLRRSVSAIDPGTGILHLAGAPANWARATMTGNSVLACYDDQDTARSILWAGVVWQRPRSWSSDDVSVSMATFESVFDRGPCVGDETHYSTEFRDDVIAHVLNTYIVSGATGMGISCLQLSYTVGGGPLLPVMDSPPVANAALVWQNTDNATPLTRMTEVFGQLGGEFTVDWSWSSDGTSLVPTARFGSRIGTPVLPGMAPGVTFEKNQLIDMTVDDDYTAGRGATRVIAYSSGQGSTTPYSTPAVSPLADGRPVIEYRYQPAPSISPTALNGFAAKSIQLLAPGAQPVTLTYSTDSVVARRYGVDWLLGDDIGYSIPGEWTDEQGNDCVSLAFPVGFNSVGRAIAVEVNEASISPILADTTTYGGV